MQPLRDLQLFTIKPENAEIGIRMESNLNKGAVQSTKTKRNRSTGKNNLIGNWQIQQI